MQLLGFGNLLMGMKFHRGGAEAQRKTRQTQKGFLCASARLCRHVLLKKAACASALATRLPAEIDLDRLQLVQISVDVAGWRVVAEAKKLG
ncbi:MAG: hypothetical protein MZV65_29760 [Chromatiales bacterium]|nr:hypothetical protein [Chromatiales bacterium]